MQRVMELFHYFGANDTVLYEAHAHIGSDKLPTIIRAMRECIIEHGGEIHFYTCVDESLFRTLITEQLARQQRIAAGSGTTVQDVNQLIRQFEQAKDMMKRMTSQMKGGRAQRMMRKFPGMR